MITEEEITKLKRCLTEVEQGYIKKTKESFKYLIDICSREIGECIGLVNCKTCRKYVVGYWKRMLKIN